ncbi:MAG TPA: hypothetical protein VK348_13180, partial [Planctomycetota bacterium]|nr:hypothetical protein [Planctomycetota bacterium]
MEHLPPAALSPFRSLAKGLLILSLNPAVAQAHVPAAAADPASPPPALTVAADQVARHGITWHFDHPYPVGSFANGDPFVVGPVRIVAIDPRCEVVDGRTLHGSMVDPDPGRLEQGFDSALLGEWTADTYRQDRNVAHVLGRDRPLELGPDHSLVSVISEPQPDDK